MKFNCDCCGICCKNIGNIPQLKFYDNGSGQCIHLTKDNKCSIYDKRPEICNVSIMYKKYYSNSFTKIEFYELNYKICIKLKNMHNSMAENFKETKSNI